jgi:tetratricopeptide (TPR) repeat protein
MQLKAVFSLSLVLLALAFQGCQSMDRPSAQNAPSSNATSPSVKSGAPADWSTGMRKMATSLEALLPYVYSQAEFNDSKNKSAVFARIEDFQNSVDVVPTHVGEDLLGKDPLLKYSVNRLKANSRQAVEAFKEGHAEFSRSLLRESVGTCFNCHSSQNMGPQYKFSTGTLSSSFRLTPNEKADYYVATRQFDQALGTLEQVLRSPNSFYDSPHDQSLALRKYLSLEVRVRKEPSRAAKTLETFINNKKLPYFLAKDSEAWLMSLREWQAEAGKKPLAPRELLQKAKVKSDRGGFQAGLIEHMRATSGLHEALRTTKAADQRAKIYFQLGSSYDVLSDLGVWDLPDVYFEACIRAQPKSSQAKECFKSFERNLIMGYSGSAGLFIPADERKHLAELKDLAGLPAVP